jgi:hypothetical protein
MLYSEVPPVMVGSGTTYSRWRRTFCPGMGSVGLRLAPLMPKVPPQDFTVVAAETLSVALSNSRSISTASM